MFKNDGFENKSCVKFHKNKNVLDVIFILLSSTIHNYFSRWGTKQQSMITFSEKLIFKYVKKEMTGRLIASSLQNSLKEIILTLFFCWQSEENSNYQACTASTAH